MTEIEMKITYLYENTFAKKGENEAKSLVKGEWNWGRKCRNETGGFSNKCEKGDKNMFQK